MDTFFFVHIDISNTGQVLRLGPYATIGAAAEIMMDCLPTILSAETTESNPKYKASISEWTVTNNCWEILNTTATEDLRG